MAPKGSTAMAEPASTPIAVDDEATGEWLRRVAALTVVPAAGCEVDELADATAGAERLALHARALLVVGAVAEETCEAGCALCDEGVCDLARALHDAFPGSFSDLAAADEADAASALADYRRALADAGTAVFTCRRTLHVSDQCLFGDAELDLCGRVLAAAHRQG
jgi:hypothetical protein